jgi:proline dehydrogenase
MGLRGLLLWLSRRPALGRRLHRAPVVRRVVRRFVPGETVDDAVDVLAELSGAGLLSAVTYLGENVATPAAAAAAADTYCRLLDAVHVGRLSTTPSLKLTHLGLDLGDDVARGNVERVLERARGAVVWLDMEDTRYTDRTLTMYRQLRVRWPNIACVVQAYLYRTEADLRALIPHGATVRLCKGAYPEPPDRAFARRADIDRNYARLAGMLLSPEARRAGAYPAFATHDDRLIRVIGDRAHQWGVPAYGFEFQMLLGIREDLHRAVAANGLRLRVLVPFGEDWYGYFMRRLAERPANLRLVLESLGRR